MTPLAGDGTRFRFTKISGVPATDVVLESAEGLYSGIYPAGLGI
jgi:hypothetical protein